jgi:hypothetical protein
MAALETSTVRIQSNKKKLKNFAMYLLSLRKPQSTSLTI